MIELAALVKTALWSATPVAYASCGEAIAERAGMLNIGLEAMLLSGAFAGVWAGAATGDPWIGVGAGLVVGAALGAMHAVLSLWAGIDQIVAGIALNLFALGTTGVLARNVLADVGDIPSLEAVRVPVLADIPFIGDALFEQRILTLLLVPIAILLWLGLRQTRTGLALRAAGEDVAAAAAEGVRVSLLRLGANVIAGALTGVGGAFLVLAIAGVFSDGMSAGRGFIALAIVIIARWNPIASVIAAFVFGLAEAQGILLQTSGSDLPFQLFLALPYVATLVILLLRLGAGRAPRELGRAYGSEVGQR